MWALFVVMLFGVGLIGALLAVVIEAWWAFNYHKLASLWLRLCGKSEASDGMLLNDEQWAGEIGALLGDVVYYGDIRTAQIKLAMDRDARKAEAWQLRAHIADLEQQLEQAQLQQILDVLTGDNDHLRKADAHLCNVDAILASVDQPEPEPQAQEAPA